MNIKTRLAVTRWLLSVALLLSILLGTRLWLFMYSTWPMDDLAAFRPSTAEEIGRQISELQVKSKEADVILRIVQRQHSALNTMYNRLEVAEDVTRLIVTASVFLTTVLTLVFSAALVLISGKQMRRFQEATKSVNDA